MFTVDEATLLAWITPVIWPFLRVLAMFSVLPVLGQRSVPMRVRVGLAFLIAYSAQASLPPQPVVALDSAVAVMLVVQQMLIGLSIGFAVRIVFAAVEFAGEVMGLQMGLNFASFFDPLTASQSTATARLFGTMVAFLFVVSNGHLTVIAAVVQSLVAFPVAPEPMAFLKELKPFAWGTQIFQLGLWIAMPLVAMLLFVNLVMGVIARVAPQVNIFGIGFPMTLGVGLLGLVFTLPLMQGPFAMTLEMLLKLFQ
jgi:flagellar biosynthesis protein FliR